MSLIDVVRSSQWKVLVVDEHSKRLLGANLKEADVLSERVTTIDLITTYRAPEPNMEAMYLIMPTTQNVDRVIRDFTDKQTYAGAWLFFTDSMFPALVFQVNHNLFNRDY
ncbi:14685_t:CDS:2 [Acaulospora colombiana]|uniref:14685_t:CDS:1 n=1 Tax=Acaulospora colombiana TaxID=27376 RepID=A0ACA9N5S3_9GLOM|nr:14685_t:CDS:2 [Acaulospora colombiana]